MIDWECLFYWVLYICILSTNTELIVNKKVIFFKFKLQVKATKTISGQVQTAFATVNITVTRNENVPVFSTNNYVTNIAETMALGSSVIQLTATDQDALVSSWMIL